MRIASVVGVLVVLWLLIGVAAAWQRGYLITEDASCASVGSTVTTILIGPLNYVGVNPAVDCSEWDVPQPSQ
ncbi:hypothetical protein J4H86_13285 [Spiractinospora alimapuensis]|uniref:hypothetical protein n=1 Tax=Spiractinospora alimapuensis TaxID=2820884 RepID=UPI001F45E594|nr:hypothetical protein [Spiractinospora alimapuensis]QVQ54544.1 hypothetical protein J4H86_13285 [Spiractinospora alimapuensis]